MECERAKEIESLALDPWADRRRMELLRMLNDFDRSVEQLDRAVEEASKGRGDVHRLMTHPGVGPIVALVFALTAGPFHRFPNSKHLVSYLGLNPTEHSSGGRQKFGRISKQGNHLHTTSLNSGVLDINRFLAICQLRRSRPALCGLKA